MYPVISVVIPAYNEEDYIAEAILSVKAQNIGKPVEIIVIDNQSTDNTASIAKKMGVDVIFEERKGIQYARARGLREAKGTYLIFMDADSRMPQGLLQKTVDYFLLHPKVAGISCRLQYYDARFVDKLSLLIFNYLVVPVTHFGFRFLGKPDIFIASYIACKTQVLRNAGGIDMDFPFLGDDTRIAMQLATAGTVRHLTNIYIKTSARRLQKQGIAKTAFCYFTVFFLLHFVSLGAAKTFSHRYVYQKASGD